MGSTHEIETLAQELKRITHVTGIVTQLHLAEPARAAARASFWQVFGRFYSSTLVPRPYALYV